MNTVEKRYELSDTVIVADVLSSRREKFQYPGGSSGTREIVNFRVREVLKGSVIPGTTFTTSTDIDNSCSLNVLNSPAFVEDRKGPIKIGKQWLLYSSGGPPREIDRVPGSMPLGVISQDLTELRRLREANRIRASAAREKPNTSLERTRDR